MKKIIRGIVDFRKNVRPSYKDTFAQLALGQHPDTLFIACSDSRVVPNLFASSDPGDLFVVRNIGNLVPPLGEHDHSRNDESVSAAIEFALRSLTVTEIIVCGHSECGAMGALLRGRNQIEADGLKNWLCYGDRSLQKLSSGSSLGEHLERHNQLSQINVLEQIEHLKTFPIVQKRINEGTLRLHGWWFDIKEANVYEFEPEIGQFRLIDEGYARILLERAGGNVELTIS